MAARHILLVTQADDVARAVDEAVQFDGVELLRAQSSEQAVELFDESCEMVIVDLAALDADAAALPETLRDQEYSAVVPMVFLGSGDESIADLGSAIEAGGDGFLRRPLKASVLCAKVQGYLGAAPVEKPGDAQMIPGPSGTHDEAHDKASLRVDLNDIEDAIDDALQGQLDELPQRQRRSDREPTKVAGPGDMPTFDEIEAEEDTADLIQRLRKLKQVSSMAKGGAPEGDVDALVDSFVAHDQSAAKEPQKNDGDEASSAQPAKEKEAKAEAKAEKEADREAKELHEHAKERAEAEAQKLKDQSRQRAQAEAERIEEEARQRARDAALKMEEEARQQAEARAQEVAASVEHEARQRAQALAQRLQEEAQKKAQEEARALEQRASAEAEKRAQALRERAREKAQRRAQALAEEARKEAEAEAKRLEEQARDEAQRLAQAARDKARKRAEERAQKVREQVLHAAAGEARELEARAAEQAEAELRSAEERARRDAEERAEQLLHDARAEAQRRAQELKQQAEQRAAAEAAKIREQAQRELEREAERLRSEALDKARDEAQKLAQQARERAQHEADELQRALTAEAEQRAQKLKAEALARAEEKSRMLEQQIRSEAEAEERRIAEEARRVAESVEQRVAETRERERKLREIEAATRQREEALRDLEEQTRQREQELAAREAQARRRAEEAERRRQAGAQRLQQGVFGKKTRNEKAQQWLSALRSEHTEVEEGVDPEAPELDASADLDAGADTLPPAPPDLNVGTAPVTRPAAPEKTSPMRSSPRAAPPSAAASTRGAADAERAAARLGEAPCAPLAPEEGLFDEGQLVAVLAEIAYQQVTGRVDFVLEGGQAQRGVFFEQGLPVLVHSTLTRDRFESYLHRKGLLTREQHAVARAMQIDGARPLGVALLEEGMLKTRELFEAVRDHLAQVVIAVLEWPRGAYRYSATKAPAAERVAPSQTALELLAEGVRRKYDVPRLLRAVGGPSTLLAPVDRARLDALGLRPDEQVAAELLDGVRTLEDLILSAGVDEQVTYRVALLGVAVGAFELSARGVEPLDADRELAEEHERAIDRARLHERLRQARELDYFSFLGLEREATGYEVEQAVAQILDELDQLRLVGEGQAELQAGIAEVWQVAQDALATLSDERSRQRYRHHLR